MTKVNSLLHENDYRQGYFRWWMNPNQEIFPVKGTHPNWALHYLDDNNIRYTGNVTNFMFKRGWIRLILCGDEDNLALSYEYGFITPSQKSIKAIKDFAIEVEAKSVFDDHKGSSSPLNEVEGTEPNIYYHVSFTDVIPKIKKIGIKPQLKPTWGGQDDIDVRQRAGVYCFTNYYDAVKWAFRTAWHIKEKTPVIVKFKSVDKDFIPDDHWEGGTAIDKWLVKQSSVKPEDIISYKVFTVNDLTPDLTKKINSLKKINENDTYRKGYSSDYSDENVEYFKVGQEDEHNTANSFCWIWSRADQGLRIKKGHTHGHNFGHDIAGNTFKGWYDPSKKAISFVFPDYELRKLGGRKPTVDDIPTNVYKKLISQFGGDNKFFVFESVKTIKVSELKQIIKELINESVYDVPHTEEEFNKHTYGGWLDPDGKFHAVSHQNHRAYAAHVLSQMKIDRTFTSGTAYEELFRRKFIRVVFSGTTLFFTYKPGDILNPRQMGRLKDLAIDRGCTKLYDEVTDNVVPDGLLQESLNESNFVGLKYWWMDTNYKFHPVKFEQHRQWAEMYLQQLGHEIKDVYRAMYKLGFVRVVLHEYGSERILSFEYAKGHALNTRQLKELKDLAIEEQCDYIVDDTQNRQVQLKESYEPTGFDAMPHRGWWLDPQETLHDTRSGDATDKKAGHWNWAKHYIQTKIKRELTEHESPNDILMKQGWIKVMFNYYADGELHFDYLKNGRVSASALRALKNLAIECHATALVDGNTNKPLDISEAIRPKMSLKEVKQLFNQTNESMSYEELMKLTTPERKERAANVNVRSLPVSVENNKEQWNFRYKSSPQTTVTDLPFKGAISFIKGNVGQNNNAMKMKCVVDCECPDFKYRFAYNDAAKGASKVGPDSLNKATNTRPKPAYDYGEGLCKHLVALSRFLKTKIQATKKSNLFEALDDVSNQGPFNVTYYD